MRLELTAASNARKESILLQLDPLHKAI